MLITKNVSIKIGGRNIKHYQALGYDVHKTNECIIVPVEHLSLESHSNVEVSCDYCGEIIVKEYRNLMRERKNNVNHKDCCKNCINKKTSETNNILYGVLNTFQRKETKEKIKKTNILRYGVENISSLETNKKNKSDRMLKKDVSEKMKIRIKREETTLKKYGVKCSLNLPQSRDALIKTQNIASSQQKMIFGMLLKYYKERDVFLDMNYVENPFSLDIILIYGYIKIDIEYDSWYWHNKKSDRKRDEVLKSRRYKILRIKSGRKIPDEELLLKEINELLNTEKKYCEIILNDWNQYYYEREEEDK